MTSPSRTAPAHAVLRSVALPSEHGGWAFLLEPILLGLLVAPSGNGLLLALSALGVFLIHQPLKLAIRDRRKGQRSARTIWAERFAVVYGLLALLPFIVLIVQSDRGFLLPLIGALPLAAIQMIYDARNQSRALVPESCGALALATTAPAIAVLGGWMLAPALVLWLLTAARAVPSILYVRARLKLERAKPADPRPAWLAHGLALVGVGGLAGVNAAPLLAIAGAGILLVRALIGLSRYRTPRRPPIIGMQEIGYGVVYAALIAIGYA